MLEQHDLGELGEKLNHLSRNDGWGQMAGCIDDDVVRLFAAVGRHDEIAGAIAEHFDGLVDEVNASVAKGHRRRSAARRDPRHPGHRVSRATRLNATAQETQP